MGCVKAVIEFCCTVAYCMYLDKATHGTNTVYTSRLHLNEKFVAHLPHKFGVVLQDLVSTRILFGRV